MLQHRPVIGMLVVWVDVGREARFVRLVVVVVMVSFGIDRIFLVGHVRLVAVSSAHVLDGVLNLGQQNYKKVAVGVAGAPTAVCICIGSGV